MHEKLFIILILFSCVAISTIAQPLLYSHNDYEQNTPLVLALKLDYNFIEIDIFYHENNIVVSHDEKNLDSKISFEQLYLKPLFNIKDQRIKRLTLLLDIKKHDDRLFEHLHRILDKYPSLIKSPKCSDCPISIILSGDINRAILAADSLYIDFQIDGRPSNIGQNISNSTMPMISAKINDICGWNGCNIPRRKDILKLKEFVDQVHKEGKFIRFWNTNDDPQTWNILIALGVDIIGTDHLLALKNHIVKIEQYTIQH